MKLPDGLRAFDDATSARTNIYNGVYDAMSKRFPVEDGDYRLELDDLRYDGPKEFSYNEQKQALLKQQRLTTPLRGKLRLTHLPTGKTVDERDEILMQVPYYSDRGTIIHNGSEYSVLNQTRLRPGVYVRRKRTGEIETQFNVEAGKGRGFRMSLEPATGIVKVNVGQSSVPVYPLLQAMGMSDNEFDSAVGKELADVNRNARVQGGLKKLYERFAGYGAVAGADDAMMSRYIAEQLPKFSTDPEVNQRTLGLKNKTGIDKDVLRRAMQKMLEVSRGETEPDDRDALEFKELLGVEDLMRERIEKDAGKVFKNILFKVKRAGSLKPVQRNAFGSYSDSLLLGSGLALPLEETNPLHYLEQMQRVTGFGEGGIGSASAVTDDAREINTNQLGFLGTLEGPECFSADTEVMTAAGWVPWPRVTSDTVFLCNVSGRYDFNPAMKVFTYDYCGRMLGVRNSAIEFLVTPNHRIYYYDDGQRCELAADCYGKDIVVDIDVDDAPVQATIAADDWYEIEYSQRVYCASVPGSKLLTRRGNGGGVWTGNSEKIGVDARVAYGAFKGNDRRIYGIFKDARTGKELYLRPDQTAQMTVGFTDSMTSDSKYVPAVRGGKTVRVPKSEIDVVLPSLSRQFSQGVNLNSMPTAMQGSRQFYSAKFWTQFMPLKEGELPLIDSLMPDGKQTFMEYYGKQSGTLRAPRAGTVKRVLDDKIVVTDESGKDYSVDVVKDFPFNRLSGISYSATVKPGDRVGQGDMLAHSNFTDAKTGSINFGRNLKTAILPARGWSNDDAAVISESAAQKLATSRLYGYDLEARHGVEMGRDKYMSLFPSKFTKDQFDKLDEHGVVKPGTVLNYGDPIILGVGPKLLTAADAQLGKLHKTLRNAFTDKAVIWEHEYPGIVTDSAMLRAGRGAAVNVKAEPPVAVGDKLSSNFAVKGVVGRIVPDDQMPRDAATNEPYEILFNPMAILSRVSPNQIIWMALAKIAKKTGKQLRLPQEPPEEGWEAWARKQLELNGVKDTSDIFDPETGKVIKDIGDGYAYVHAFHHLSEKKLSARGGGGAYTSDLSPAKGGYSGAKRFSSLDVGAALSHGATAVLHDVAAVRGTKNEELWKALKHGQPLPPTGTPFVYTKFMNMLKAGGINVEERGSKTKLLPMTDKAVEGLGAKEIRSAEMLDYNFRPRPGGLFDPGLTGGPDGKNWTYVRLDEPVPNPIMEEPIRRVLGITGKKLRNVLAGTETLDNGGNGGVAIQQALAAIDVDTRIKELKKQVASSRGTARDSAIKAIAFLDSAKKQGIHPKEWMVTRIPVLPPVFRPIARMGDMGLVADMNELYRDLIEARNSAVKLSNEVGPAAAAEDRLNVYDAVRAVYGLGDPITPEGQSKRLKGAIWQITGDSPKHGMFQSRVVAKTVDNVARAVITPDPNLDMDHIGIPEPAAWDSYKNFVIRRLVRNGYPMLKATELVRERAPVAKSALLAEMEDRPVIVDRAPTWHKFNLMGFKPVLVEGNTIRVSPLVTKGFNADFDGDNQHGIVFLSLPRDKYYSILSSNLLQSRVPDAIVADMQTKQLIPVTTSERQVFICDLADFPHGELERRIDGAKGPIDFFTALPDTQVLSFDETIGKPVWAKVSHYSKHYAREVEIVTLASGHQIITDDDPRAVYGLDPETNEMVRCTPTEALARNIVVPYAKAGDSLFTETASTASVPVDGTFIKSLNLDSDTGYMLGAICGDGWWDHKDYDYKSVNTRLIYLADLKGEVADKLFSVFQKYDAAAVHRTRSFLKTEDSSRYGDTVKHTFNFNGCMDLAVFFDTHLGGERDERTSGSANKHLPSFAFTAPRAFREAMLCGLIDTDGTCAVSTGKSKPQLMISFGSTSLRLCREVALLARSLGIESSISFSQMTTANNPAWIVTLSAVDAKRSNVFANLACSGKRNNFLSTAVELDVPHGNGNHVAVPDCVANAIRNWLTAPKLTAAERELDTDDVRERKRKLSVYQLMYAGAKEKTMTRAAAAAVVRELQALERGYTADRDAALRLLTGFASAEGTGVACTASDIDCIRTGIRAVANSNGDVELYRAGLKLASRLNAPLKNKRLPKSCVADVYAFISGHSISMQVVSSEVVKNWILAINDLAYSWSRVVSVEKTGRCEDGYDLTVPGYETFTTAEGLVLSNTMSMHVPVTDKAKDEVKEKMLPSKNLFSTTDLESPQHTPRMELTMGLYMLTRPPSDKPVRKFATAADVKAAYRRGEISANDPVEVGNV